MPPGFYELLGVEPPSSAARIRSAYGQALARLTRLRRARVTAGEATETLDRERVHLDEAWEVLSDPLRRRRYDALRAWQAGDRPTDPEAVWEAVGESLVHPAAQVAARLLRVTSQLTEIGELPRAPSGAAIDPATLIPHDDDLTTPRDIIRPARDRRHLRLVEGGPDEAGVIVLPQPRRPRAAPGPVHPGGIVHLPDDEVRILLEEHGHSGAFLRSVRERMGLTARALSDETKISEAYLCGLEDEDWAALPSLTFVRGYVREVARTLGLDADAVVTGFMRRYPRS